MSSIGETFAGDAPPYYYIAFIDEAGDSGIERVRPIDEAGGSEWLVMGCALIEAHEEAKPVDWVRLILDQSAAKNRPALHFRDLQEWQKPLACQELAKLPVNVFAMLSNKKNMRQHKNERAAAKSSPLVNKQFFYNFCSRVILERVTDCVLRHSMRTYGEPRFVKIVFSKRYGHSYGHTFAYSELLKLQARAGTTVLDKRTVRWEVMNYRLLTEATPDESAGLQLADIAASSFFQAVDMLPPTQWDPRNARLLKPCVARHNGSYENHGVTFLPFKYDKAKLRPEQIDIFDFYGFHRFDFSEQPYWWKW